MKIGIFGINGKMGSLLASEVINNPTCSLIWGVDPINLKPYKDIPIYDSLINVSKPDCLIDFSHHSHIYDILQYAIVNKVPLVIATTAHNEKEISLIKEASIKIPIFYSANLSYGIQVIKDILREYVKKLKSYDIEIEEVHHRNKFDAPSGTGKMLKDVINLQLAKPINIHSIRGGSVVGTHKIMFMTDGEVITIKHEALSKEVFVKGALKAAKFIVNKQSGLYNMDDLIKGEDEEFG